MTNMCMNELMNEQTNDQMWKKEQLINEQTH